MVERGYRLPFRSEWQHACQSLSQGVTEGPTLGLHDMRGGLSEWVIEDSAPQGLFRGHVAMGGNSDSSPDDCQCDSMIRSTEDWWDEDPEFPPSPWWATSDESRQTGFRIVSPLAPMTNDEKKLYWDPDSKKLSDDVKMSVRHGRGTFGIAKSVVAAIGK